MQRLAVSENRRYLVHADGTPFFYLGDTAWELFHRLNRQETDLYLQTRAAQQYSVIQAVALAEFDGLTEPNTDGNLPLHDLDPARPNEDYFRHVDYGIDRANALGLYVGLLPTWGDKWNKKWGVGPEIFTPENAYVYGEFLGKRYKDRGIFWILGGDRPLESELHFAVYRAMADGVRAGDGGAHLRTFHPTGGKSSADDIHADPRLDFNMLQSGHDRRNIPNYAMIASDYARTPVKPCLDSEPNYEEHAINWKLENGYFNEYDVRKSAYRAVFAGAFGHTYGCQCIWQFWHPGREPIAFARVPWQEAMFLPGAKQMKHLRSLMESRPFLSRLPDPSLLIENSDDAAAYQVATRDEAGTYAFVYTPLGEPVFADVSRMAGNSVRASWFNPRTGTFEEIGTLAKKPLQELRPPSSGEDRDWILVLDAIP